MIDISPEYLQIVKDILKQYVPNCEVRVFGSRYKWLSKPYSDLDLAIMGKGKLGREVIYKLQEAFEESELSFRVDVLDWHAISDEFRTIIEQGYEVIQEKSGLPAGWVVKRLGDVVDVSSSRRIFAKEYVEYGIPFYRGKEIIEKNRNNKISTEIFISVERFNEIKNKYGAPKNGDLLLTSVGTLGIPYIIKDNEVFYFKDGNLTWFRNWDGLDNKFLYYWFTSEIGINAINKITIGSTQQAITINALSNLEITLPPLEEQKEIATILSSLDDKIELNQQMNKKLEEMAQAIFKQWFIDFNFPDENGKPYRDSGGAMVDSELGQIPAGWSIGVLGDSVDIVGGGTPSTKNSTFWADGAIYWSTPKDLSVNKDIFLKNTLKKITCLGLKEISSGLLPIKTLLLSSRAPIGYLAISNINLAINQGYIAILPTSKFNTLFLYIWLKNNMDKIISMANGSTFQEISKKSFKMISFVNYPVHLVEQYMNLIEPVFQQINILESGSINLQDSRDSLLPKLMSGELRI